MQAWRYVVNSVMCGFSTKLKDRLHGILADVLVEARNMNGMSGVAGKMEKIRNSPIGHLIDSMAPALESFAMIQFKVRNPDNPFEDETITRTVRLIGIDPEAQARVDGFSSYLRSQKPVKEGDELQPVKDPSPARCFELSEEGQKLQQWLHPSMAMFPQDAARPSPANCPGARRPAQRREQERRHHHRPRHRPLPFRGSQGQDQDARTVDDPARRRRCRLHRRRAEAAAGHRRYALADYFQSEMSEYDSNYAYVPLGVAAEAAYHGRPRHQHSDQAQELRSR